MFVDSGSVKAISFTDDTSLDSRLTEQQKVSVHAQVLREKPLDWYYSLVAYFPQIKGELKSTTLIDNYFSLPAPTKNKIQSTLKEVRIHITDPRPYIADLKAAISQILLNQNVDEFLTRLEIAHKELSEKLQRDWMRLLARRMLWDSPSERLKTKYRLLRNFRSLRRFFPQDYVEPWIKFDYSPFEDNKARIQIKTISVFTSKSASVFSYALDELTEDPYQAISPIGAWRLNRALCIPHAFDAGNDKAINWIDERRSDVLSLSDEYFWFRHLESPAQLESIDSKQSLFVQAADIAAGIAKAIFERQDIVQVVRAFDYVTFNGQRLSEDDAISIHKNRVTNRNSI